MPVGGAACTRLVHEQRLWRGKRGRAAAAQGCRVGRRRELEAQPGVLHAALHVAEHVDLRGGGAGRGKGGYGYGQGNLPGCMAGAES